MIHKGDVRRERQNIAQSLCYKHGRNIVMTLLSGTARQFVKKIRNFFQSILLSVPKNVQCNICGWEGRHFASDSWHKHVICPKCRSQIRQRLFFAALQNSEEWSYPNIIASKKILHFAPEEISTSVIRKIAAQYVTADYFRKDCDLNLDISYMPRVLNDQFDIVIAFDVLEHVPDYQMALKEVHRVLCSKGIAIFTVPQKDNLDMTYEDSSIVSNKDRTKHFGQWDHLRIFGDDFSRIVESKGFSVDTINESDFSDEIVNKHVLFPPILSRHPLATNYRKVFFCRKSL